MITIRLFRIGKKKQPSYKIVVTDKKNSPTGGRFIDEVGFYNPITKERSVDGDKVKYWIGKGASVSDTVHNLLVTEGVIEAKKRPQHGLPGKKEGEDEVATEIKTEEVPKTEEDMTPEVKDAEAETTLEKETVSEDKENEKVE